MLPKRSGVLQLHCRKFGQIVETQNLMKRRRSTVGLNSIPVSILNNKFTVRRRCKVYGKKSRTQGSRPRTQKKSEAKAKDRLSSRPRTGMLKAKDTTRKCSQKKRSLLKNSQIFRKIQAFSEKKNE